MATRKPSDPLGRVVPIGVLLPRVVLDLVEPDDPRQHQVRPPRVDGPGVVELPPGVHPAADLDDLAIEEQAMVGRIGVGLEAALDGLRREGLQPRPRMALADEEPRPIQSRYLSGLYPLEEFAPLLGPNGRASGHGSG
jgi:hypothetical protein